MIVMPKVRTKLNTEALEASIEAKKKAGMSDIPAEIETPDGRSLSAC